MARQMQVRRLKRGSKYKVSSAKRLKSREAYKPYDSIRGTNPAHTVVCRGIGFPDRMFTKLVYSDSIVLDPSAGTPTPSFALRMNSIYDPQFSIGGGQPTYYDQLALIYKQYRVVGSKLTANFSYTNTTTADIGPAIVGITSSDAGLPTTDAGTLISAPNTSFATLVVGDIPKNVVSTYSQKQVFPGLESTTSANFGADPSSQWYANIFASPQGVDVEKPINCVFILEFMVEVWDVKNVVDT